MSPIGQAGRVRLSPLQAAVMSSKAGTTSAPAGSNGSAGVASGVQASTLLNNTTEAPTPEQVADAQQRAAQGDQEAIDWLKIIGIGGGVAGAGVAGTALYHALRNKKPPQGAVPPMRASSVPVKAPSTAVTVAAPQAPQIENVPVTALKDEHVVHPLPMPEEARALQNMLKVVRRIR